MLKKILENLKNEGYKMPSLLKISEIQKILEKMDENQLKELVNDLFENSYEDKVLLSKFLKKDFSIDNLYDMTPKALEKLWEKLKTNIEKILIKLKRNDLLNLKDEKICAKEIRNQLKDYDSLFCENIYYAIWDNYKNKMFKNPKDVTDWMEKFRFCEALRDLKDKELCEIEQEGIKSIEIIDKGGDEHISVSSRASVFTVTYEIIINKHIKFDVNKTNIDSI
jgi:hypothetical protein